MSENFLAAHNIQGLAFFFFKQELYNEPSYNPLFSTLTKAMLGKPVFSKINEFKENFRTAFDPAPPSEIFRKFIHFWKDGLPNTQYDYWLKSVDKLEQVLSWSYLQSSMFPRGFQ